MVDGPLVVHVGGDGESVAVTGRVRPDSVPKRLCSVTGKGGVSPLASFSIPSKFHLL